MTSACPCDEHGVPLVDNPPGMARIAARRDDWRSIRRALLAAREGETALSGWNPAAGPDLSLMMAEWWATLGEILEFYNDEIANEAFLGTARRRESITRLVSLLGYRPRPALAATVTLAGIVDGREAVALPQGFAVESIPPPGKQPQSFELDAAITLPPGGAIPVQPPAALAAPESGVMLLEGKARGLANGDRLRLRTASGAILLTVAAVEPSGAHTRLHYTPATAIAATTRARDCRLERPGQSLPVWTLLGAAALVGSDLHLAAMTRGIAAGDTVLLSAPGQTAYLSTVSAVYDAVWYANAAAATAPQTAPASPTIPLPVPHSVLTLASPPTGWASAGLTVSFGWVEVAGLADQPPAAWTGTPTGLAPIAPAQLPASTARPVLVADANDLGVPAALTASAGAAQGDAVIAEGYGDDTALAAPLSILTGLLAMTRGKTVAAETLGSGDARLPGQSFTLAKSPVTYVRRGGAYASSVLVRVGGVPWTEVDTLYGQHADAAVYILREDEAGKTVITFGDGVRGRRLPTGTDNVVARYRYGAGAETPMAGQLTRIVKPLPGLARMLNPVAASGGADAEPLAAIARYAPRQVLTLGRAVSTSDFGAFASSAAAPNRTRTVWAWDDARQRAVVTVYVAGDAGVRAAVAKSFDAVGDPLRPVTVSEAEAITTALSLSMRIAPGYDAAAIAASVTDALAGEKGLFCADRLGIGQPLFTSAVDAAVLTVPGVVTVLSLSITTDGSAVPATRTLLVPDENQWYDLTADRVTITCEVVDG